MLEIDGGASPAEQLAHIDSLWVKPGPGRPRTKARIDELLVIPDLFQTRAKKEVNANHVDHLMRTINATKGGIHPIQVCEVRKGEGCDGGLLVINGHHRLEAYRKLRHKEVPIEVQKVPPSVARVRAVQNNSLTKLTETLKERTEAAWQSVCLGPGYRSRKELARDHAVSERTVAYQRRAWRQFHEKFSDSQPHQFSWWQVREAIKTGRLEEDHRKDHEAAHQRRVEKLTERLRKIPVEKLMGDPKALAEALLEVQPVSTRGLLVELRHAVADDDEGRASRGEMVDPMDPEEDF